MSSQISTIGRLAPWTTRPRPHSARRWAILSFVITMAVVTGATIIGVAVGVTGAAMTPVPQAIAAPPLAATGDGGTAGAADGGGGTRGDGGPGGRRGPGGRDR